MSEHDPNDNEVGGDPLEYTERRTSVSYQFSSLEYVVGWPRRQSNRHRGILRQFVWGLILSFLLLMVSWAFETTELGEHLSWITYGFLQRRLTPQDSSSIAIVDISELQQDESGITSRDKLKHLLSALAASHPKVIGVDVDFSPIETDGDTPGAPKRWQFVLPKDYTFFEFCKNLGVPVYLGIYRTQLLPPEAWLGMAQYKELAAALLTRERAKKVFQSFGEHEGLTMSSAIAKDQKQNKEPDKEPDKSFFFQRVSEPESEKIHGKEFIVDYSPLDRLKRGAIKVPGYLFDDEPELKKLFHWRSKDVEGKRILVGDVERAYDTFEDPTHGPTPMPGVLIHAAAAQTQLQLQPLLREFRPWVRHWADLFVALLGLVVIAGLRWIGEKFDEAKLQVLLTGFAVVLTLAIGLTVNYTRILWDGFLIVAAFHLFNHFAEKIIHPLPAKVRSWVRSTEN